MSLIAQELAKDSQFQVSLITGNYGQPAIINHGRLSLYKTNLFNFLHLLKRVDADVYVERTINPKIILLGLWCKLFKKKFIYMVAHDWDLNHRVIKLADLIITQHQQQNAALNGHSLVMPPLMEIIKNKKSFQRQYVLWVGRADNWKRPADFIRLARRYPQEKFVMICRPGRIKFSPPPLPNLKFFSTVPFPAISHFFAQAKVLVNTSTAEGFPNTFLQAGAAKTPVLSFRVNPDHYLTQYRCGRVGRLLVRLDKDMGQNHYRYVKKFHSLKNIELLKRALYKL